MIQIDGSQGEGGGQVLRTSLTLSLLTGQPFEIRRIRAGREEPGLRPQHLECVRAATMISEADCEGDEVGSESLTFSPDTVAAGAYEFRIATAGALTLVLQTVLLPLLRARGPSLLTLTGGTHVPWSPTIDYLGRVFLPSIEAAGYPHAKVRVEAAGYYPRGGGEVKITLPEWDGQGLRPLLREERGKVEVVAGISVVSLLAQHVADRQAGRAEARIRAMGFASDIEGRNYESRQPGTGIVLFTDGGAGPIGASSLGVKGKPAERVADEACDELARALATGAAVDPHLADQLVLPLSIIPGESVFTTSEVTPHLRTNIAVVGAFLGAEIRVEGREGEPGRVVVRGQAPPP